MNIFWGYQSIVHSEHATYYPRYPTVRLGFELHTSFISHFSSYFPFRFTCQLYVCLLCRIQAINKVETYVTAVEMKLEYIYFIVTSQPGDSTAINNLPYEPPYPQYGDS